MTQDAGTALPHRICPQCRGVMEPGFILGLPDRLMWVPPKFGKLGPEYSEWQTPSPLYPRGGNLFVGPRHLPLSYRCSACWIYWIGPDESRPGIPSEPPP